MCAGLTKASWQVDDKQHWQHEKRFHRTAQNVAAYNAIGDSAAAAAGVTSIDLHAFTELFGPGVYRDHVHFSDTVANAQGLYVAHFVEQCLKRRQDTSSEKTSDVYTPNPDLDAVFRKWGA